VTTKAKRGRKKTNREKGRIEKLARLADDALAHADDDVPAKDAGRPESEKAAAMSALAAARKLRKKFTRDS